MPLEDAVHSHLHAFSSLDSLSLSHIPNETKANLQVFNEVGVALDEILPDRFPVGRVRHVLRDGYRVLLRKNKRTAQIQKKKKTIQ
jgi:hypothetical protein